MRSISVTSDPATGAAGAAVATAQLGVEDPALVRSVHLIYAGAPNTTSVALANMGRTFLTWVGNAEVVKNPVEPVHDSVGVAIANAVAGGPQMTPVPVHGTVAVAIATSDPGATVTVVILLSDE